MIRYDCPKPISGLFAVHYPPLIPCMFNLFVIPKGIPRMTFRLNQGCWTVALNTGKVLVKAFLKPSLYRETLGSLKFPSYPFEYMPWSRTTVVSSSLVIALRGLLPSILYMTSAFLLHFNEKKIGVYPLTTIIFFSKLNTGPTFLIQSGSGLPLPGLPSDLPIDLLTKL